MQKNIKRYLNSQIKLYNHLKITKIEMVLFIDLRKSEEADQDGAIFSQNSFNKRNNFNKYYNIYIFNHFYL